MGLQKWQISQLKHLIVLEQEAKRDYQAWCARNDPKKSPDQAIVVFARWGEAAKEVSDWFSLHGSALWERLEYGP